MLRKALMLFSCIFILMFSSMVFASYSSFQYPKVPLFNEKEVNGEFHIYVKNGGIWEETGKIGFDKYFRQRTIDISRYADSGKTVKILLKKEGGGMAHIDSVHLNNKPPLKVSGTDADIKKFTKDDFDVADATDKGIEMEFNAVEGRAIINLTARIEEKTISKTPFQFPVENLYKEVGLKSKFYTYKIDTGSRNERQIFKEYSVSGSGHPSGYTYGRVSNDRENLYVTIDFTPDNTMDGDKDYAAVYVKTGDSIKEFKVSTVDERWGKAHFTYTDNVSYEHKLYRFQIPFKEIGEAKELELAFSAYGTAAPPGGDFGRTTRQYLVAYEKSTDIYGQFVDENGNAVGTEFVISNAANGQYNPSVAYNSSTNQYLVVWQDYISGISYDICGQLVNANGTLSGGNFVISYATNDQYNPSVAYNSSTNQYLVVWHDYRSGTNFDIYGQRVNANGNLLGGDFAICNETHSQYNPSVAYNSSANQYLVVWHDYRDGTPPDIYGQLVDTNGNLVNINFLIQNNAYVPHAIANTFCPNYLVAFWDEDSDVYSWTLYGEPCQQEAIPTMNEWGMIIFIVLAGIGSLYYLRRRHSV